MDKISLKLSDGELRLMSGLCGSVVDAYKDVLMRRDDDLDLWGLRLKVASLVKLNVKLAGKIALSKREQKMSFSVLELGGFMSALSDFKWDESDAYVLAFVQRLRQSIEPKIT